MNLKLRKLPKRLPQRSPGRSVRWCALAGLSIGLFVWPALPAYSSPPGKVAYERLRQRGGKCFFDAPLPEGINAPTPREMRPPTTGTNELVLLTVDFNDLAGTKTQNDFDNLLCGGTDLFRLQSTALTAERHPRHFVCR